MTLAALLLVHGDDPAMEFVYFVASVMLMPLARRSPTSA